MDTVRGCVAKESKTQVKRLAHHHTASNNSVMEDLGFQVHKLDSGAQTLPTIVRRKIDCVSSFSDGFTWQLVF